MIEGALHAFRNGKPVLIFDSEDREGETDIAFPAEFVKPEDVRMMRKEGGGLICVAIHPKAAERLGLPFMVDILRRYGGNVEKSVEREGDVKYDRRSSFSLWVNHRRTFTGIPDKDRALTIREIGKATSTVLKGKKYNFYEHFRTPGHVAILRAANELLSERVGQTELSVALAILAGVTPAVAICEMLGDDGNAFPKDEAELYAMEHGIPFVEGKDIVKLYESVLKKSPL